MVKVHVQVGGFDPRDPLLRPAWGLLAEAGVPAVVHCGHGPIPGAHTGLDVFGEVLAEHPRLPVVLAHAGMPDFDGALDLVRRYASVPPRHDDGRHAVQRAVRAAAARLAGAARRRRRTGSCSAPTSRTSPTPTPSRCAAVAGWAAADDRLGDGVPALGAARHPGATAPPLS